jgi:hypothetical protein
MSVLLYQNLTWHVELAWGNEGENILAGDESMFASFLKITVR